MEDTSRAFLAMPLLINTDQGYTVYPLLDMPYKLKKDYQQLVAFKKKMNNALAEDGLGIGDSHEDNFMYDKQGKLWRIDLSSLYELKQSHK